MREVVDVFAWPDVSVSTNDGSVLATLEIGAVATALDCYEVRALRKALKKALREIDGA